ncbi:MAG: TldD/PmbA family protein [Acidimicrobiia bacterium]
MAVLDEPTELDAVAERLAALLPTDVDFASARFHRERAQSLSVRDAVVQPPHRRDEVGVMVSLWHDGGTGYAATSDLSDAGLAAAVAAARAWLARTRGLAVLAEAPLGHRRGSYRSTVVRPFEELSFADRIELLRGNEARLRIDERIVDSEASLHLMDLDSVTVTNGGASIAQSFRTVFPALRATANEGANTQTRTYGGGAYCGQGGIEVLDRFGFADAADRVARQALELLDAPTCPEGRRDLLLAPDQMILQIHESIGHPLELDRILGDERNFAGTSFVSLSDFGTYRYGSDLLNVTFDPTVEGQMASYAFDDDGTPAERQHLIRNGILERGLGGSISQTRAGVAGVANSRASAWNRPAIDRMANLNVEPGDATFDELVAQVERGVYLETNNSWSIDDSRNKFQFGCEYGRLIEDGRLTTVVRNPGYRGVSATFWRSLIGVGNRDTWQVMGTPNCGKGEPNQVIWVGHAAPACLFRDVEVFGGE